MYLPRTKTFPKVHFKKLLRMNGYVIDNSHGKEILIFKTTLFTLGLSNTPDCWIHPCYQNQGLLSNFVTSTIRVCFKYSSLKSESTLKTSSMTFSLLCQYPISLNVSLSSPTDKCVADKFKFCLMSD